MPETERTYRIGDLAARAALSRDTLRDYERLGLLEHPLRTSGGFRLYSEATLDRLQFIKRAQAVGFSLGEVREIITFAGRGSARCQQVQDLVAEKLADLDERLSELRAFRRSLVSSLRECETALREQRDPACPVVERGVPRAVSTSVRQPVSEFTEAPPRARSGKGPGRREAVAVCS